MSALQASKKSQMVSAFLTSLLVRQYLMLEEAGFLLRHPHAWLAWEPGNWAAPGAKGASMETRLPESAAERRPIKGEALCFELNAKLPVVSLGRDADNEICIPDATVSRRHLVLELRNGHWHTQPVSATSGVSIGAISMERERWHRLERQQKMNVGGVELTFLEPADLLARVKAAAAVVRS